LGALGPEWSLRFDERCIVAGRAVLFYFYKLIWPAKLTFIYPRWQFTSPWLLLFPAVVVISVIALWFGRHRIGKAPLAAAAFFIVTLSPVLGFMNAYAQQFSFVADHWQYLGSLGVISLASAVPQLLPFRTRSLRAICLLLPIVALGVLTWRQCPIYRNVETLWRDTLSKNWNCWIAQNNLGFVLKETGRFAEAEQHFRAAIEMKPRYGEAENNLGEALLAQDKVDEAGAHIDNSLRINPHYVAANWDKALVSLRQGKRDEAYAIVSEGLHQRSIYLPGLNNFAWLLATSRDPKLRDPHRAEELARRCCEVSGYTSPRYLDTLAAAYAAQSQFEEAQKIAREAVSLALKSNRTNTAARIKQHLELYQSGQSYIEQ
jgi:tetratricopeptide (TPR) repeat protein